MVHGQAEPGAAQRVLCRHARCEGKLSEPGRRSFSDKRTRARHEEGLHAECCGTVDGCELGDGMHVLQNSLIQRIMSMPLPRSPQQDLPEAARPPSDEELVHDAASSFWDDLCEQTAASPLARSNLTLLLSQTNLVELAATEEEVLWSRRFYCLGLCSSSARVPAELFAFAFLAAILPAPMDQVRFLASLRKALRPLGERSLAQSSMWAFVVQILDKAQNGLNGAMTSDQEGIEAALSDKTQNSLNAAMPSDQEDMSVRLARSSPTASSISALTNSDLGSVQTHTETDDTAPARAWSCPSDTRQTPNRLTDAPEMAADLGQHVTLFPPFSFSFADQSQQSSLEDLFGLHSPSGFD